MADVLEQFKQSLLGRQADKDRSITGEAFSWRGEATP
jgi:hypothetical protein